MGTAEIVRFLNREGYRTYHGGVWKSSAIIKILKNEKYVGDLVQKKTYTPDYLTHEKRSNRGQVPQIRIKNHHEPIISREVWDLAQKRLEKNNKHGEGGKAVTPTAMCSPARSSAPSAEPVLLDGYGP